MCDYIIVRAGGNEKKVYYYNEKKTTYVVYTRSILLGEEEWKAAHAAEVLVHLQHHHHATRPRLHLLLLVLVYSCHEVSLAPLMAVASSEEAPDHCDFSLSSSMNMAEALLDGGCVCVCCCCCWFTTTTVLPHNHRGHRRGYVCVCVLVRAASLCKRGETNAAANEATLKKAVRTKE